MNRTIGLVVYNVDEAIVPWDLGTFVLPDWLWVTGDNSGGDFPTLLPGAIWERKESPFPIQPVTHGRGSGLVVNMPVVDTDGAHLCWMAPVAASLQALRGSVAPVSSVFTLLGLSGGDARSEGMEPTRKNTPHRTISASGDLNMARTAALYNCPADQGAESFYVPSMFNNLMHFNGGMNVGEVPRISLCWERPGMATDWSEWRKLSSAYVADLGLPPREGSVVVGTATSGVPAESLTATGSEKVNVKTASTEQVSVAAHTAAGEGPNVTGVVAFPGLLIVEGTVLFTAPSMFNSSVRYCAPESADKNKTEDKGSEAAHSWSVVGDLSTDISGSCDLLSITVTGGIRGVVVSSDLPADETAY